MDKIYGRNIVHFVGKVLFKIIQTIVTFAKAIKVQAINKTYHDLHEFWVGTASPLMIHGGHSEVIVRPVFAFVTGGAKKAHS